jgi:anti-sigma-K factor RskA
VSPRKDDVANFSGAYALNALDAAERKRFEAHLAESEETRNEVTELTDTAVLLGLAVQPETPGAALREGILAKLDSTPQLPRETAPEGGAQPISGLAVPAAEQRARARWFTRPIAALTAVAAAVAIIVGGGVIANTIGSTTFQQQQADQLAAIYAADDSKRADVEIAGGGTATLVWSAQLGQSALIVEGLEPLASDEVYELWYIDDDGPRAAGTFTVTAEAGGTWRVLDGEMGAGDIVGVTVEPRGGSTIPTTDPVIVVETA